MKYLVAQNNQQYGPFSLAEIAGKLKEGVLLADDLVWTHGWETWKPVSALIEDPEKPEPTLTPPWYKRKGFHILLLLAAPYLQIALMWSVKALSLSERKQFTIVGCLWIMLCLFIGFATPEHEKLDLPESPRTDRTAIRADADQSETMLSETPSERLASMNQDEAFEYGRSAAYAVFKEASLKTQAMIADGSISALHTDNTQSGIRPITTDNYIQMIHAAFPAELPPDSIKILTKNARAAGIDDEVVLAYTKGYQSGANEIRSGKQQRSNLP